MRRQGGGQILNIGSLAGLVPVPFWGLYSASKFAVEGYTEALWHELGPLGIHVSLIEPGFVRTGLARHGAQADHRIEQYARWRGNAQTSIAAHTAQGTPPGKVARTVARVLDARAPRLRYTVGSDAALVSRLRRILPESVFRRIWRREFDLDRPAQQRTPDATVA
jgi:short-subunit dehydrogenase